MGASITELLSTLKDEETIALVKQKLEAGEDPMGILAEAREGMKIVGDNFSKGTLKNLAIFKALFKPERAASAVRTLALTEIFIPI